MGNSQSSSHQVDFLSIDSEKCLRYQVPNNNYIRMMIQHLTCDKCDTSIIPWLYEYQCLQYCGHFDTTSWKLDGPHWPTPRFKLAHVVHCHITLSSHLQVMVNYYISHLIDSIHFVLKSIICEFCNNDSLIC